MHRVFLMTTQNFFIWKENKDDTKIEKERFIQRNLERTPLVCSTTILFLESQLHDYLSFGSLTCGFDLRVSP